MPAFSVSSFVLLLKSMPVKLPDFKPVIFRVRKFRQPFTSNAFSVVCVWPQLTSSVLRAEQLFKFRVWSMAWLTSVKSSPMMRLAP